MVHAALLFTPARGICTHGSRDTEIKSCVGRELLPLCVGCASRDGRPGCAAQPCAIFPTEPGQMSKKLMGATHRKANKKQTKHEPKPINNFEPRMTADLILIQVKAPFWTLLEHCAGSWTGWPLTVPSNPNHSMILCLYSLYLCRHLRVPHDTPFPFAARQILDSILKYGGSFIPT